MRIINWRLSNRGRNNLSNAHGAMANAIPPGNVGEPPPAEREAAVIRTGDWTNADESRWSGGVESAQSLIATGTKGIEHEAAKSDDHNRRAAEAQGRADEAETQRIDSEQEIEKLVDALGEDQLAECERHPLVKRRVALEVLFGAADAGAVFFALQFLTNVDEDNKLHVALTVVLSLLGIVLVLTGLAAGRHSKDAFVAWKRSRTNAATAEGGDENAPTAGDDASGVVSWLEEAVAAVVFVVLVAVEVSVVGALRHAELGDGAKVQAWVVVLFTALAPIGTSVIEFLARIPLRARLDELERRAGKALRRSRRALRRALRFARRRDRALARGRGLLAKLSHQVDLAWAAVVTDIAARRAAQPGTFGTVPVEVPPFPQAVTGALEALDDRIETSAAEAVRVGPALTTVDEDEDDDENDEVDGKDDGVVDVSDDTVARSAPVTSPFRPTTIPNGAGTPA